MTRVGVLGGGQLGTMLGAALADLGAEVAFYDPDGDAPAALRYRDVTVARWTDEAAMAAFAARCDVVTYEMEHVEIGPALERLAKTARLIPSLAVLSTAQDRAREKEHLRTHGFPCADFAVAATRADAERIAATFPRPFIVKTARGGYDGKGQALVRDGATPVFDHDGTYVFEEALDLTLEASCIVARTTAQTVAFPPFENVHANHVLDTTLVPARLSPALAASLEETARRLATSLDVEGLLTVEFFVTRAGASRSAGTTVGEHAYFVNEVAPRPHNSGHVTRKACTIDQFEMLARVLVGAPLAKPTLAASDAFVMGNLLGDVWLAQGRGGGPLDLGAWARFPEVDEVCIYGKREARDRRKMGHFIVRAATPAEALTRAAAFRAALAQGA